MNRFGYTDPFIRNEREAWIVARADQLGAKFAERAPKHDLEGSFPFENFEDLKTSGYLKLTVPESFGGEEASVYEMVLAQERLARGDGSTALAVGWHIGQMLQLRLSGAWPAPLFEKLCKDVVAEGVVMNELASEPATGSPSRGGRPETTARRVTGGWSITGRKTFSTLSPILKQFVVTAGMEHSENVGAFLVRSGPGVKVEETWNTLGMRATGSHDVILEDVFVPDAEVIRGLDYEKPEEPVPTEGVLLHIPACYMGIAYAARNFAIDFARHHKPNSLTVPIAELPNIKRQIAQIEVDLLTARSYLYQTADRWDKEVENRASLKPELGLAKYIVTNAAVRIVDQAMRIVGGLSLSRNLPLERMYRDVRAGLHNPPMDDMVLTNLANRAIQEAADEGDE
ncbi:acyl-CoA dehydrogenase [Paenibacillus glucanolyticus]|uniref:acyl-CoA dehydrogenase family protein n=1 Tax=Paenibacillus TaxID=44249 RepID=UPI0003E22970|nr:MULTISPECIES: acyl-CoA dehydrogenase family protein [Paenibacillus]ANA80833.1 acyl-CoA dehydrogenase [Paenibacillus glucanolyticus]AVV55095.1 acyl-CoA dehydrogenase [Paenibacillus glucanolyticus]ETT40541.1 Acyl-CoA dehydrogenase type 2 domain-containing protein [Paenibacillus sp. FSL R5-808]